ncbi:putative pentatricopeptide repeat-containing protein At1g10330 [Neltuma alba]|uniref:putative pentatricopeptide repeat-containing protein At1g10330 n=1 Tax=Neltuma alba TaxID=207710 RepID=UPI0010A5100B|nr:putative pentatricopeptide repeat-containing protein At1g10330 [Prosopis alba]
MTRSPEFFLTLLQRFIKHTRLVAQIHSQVIINGHLLHYSNAPSHLRWTSTLLYNALIRAHHISGISHKALLLFTHMLAGQVPPNDHTFPPLIKAASPSPSLGRALHTQVIKRGVLSDQFVQTTFIALYARSNNLAYACKVFDEIPHVCIVACNAMLHAFCTHGDMESAMSLFERMCKRDVVSWTTMINGFARSAKFGRAIQLFGKMMAHRDVLDRLVMPNEATYVSVLSSCANLDGKAALDCARQLHGYIVMNEIFLGVFVGTSLVDVYGKMGCLNYAVNVFNCMVSREVCTWNAMISSLASNGREEEALNMFEYMEAEGLRPNSITFVAVLTACSRGRLVKEGLDLFRSMSNYYDVVPSMEHYGCVVDLLGRAGHLEEAADIINNMPFQPDTSVLLALLSACRIHGAISLGEEMGRKLLESRTQHCGQYVLLSSINADKERWDHAADMRKEMMQIGIQKIPAFSMVHLK